MTQTDACAYFAAGCFWGVEAYFKAIAGVKATRVGYMGGHTSNPTYRQVCQGDTGHAEVVKVTFDPSKLSFTTLVEAFWRAHNPTTYHRQGPDVGSQYRSAIFVTNATHKEEALASKAQLSASHRFPDPIVTEISEADTFYEAEDYHQDYVAKHGGHCAETEFNLC